MALRQKTKMKASPMKLLFRSFLFLYLVLSLVIPSRAEGPLVVGYLFPQGKAVVASQIDAHALSRINYAFAIIRNGQLAAESPSDAANFRTLATLRQQNPNLEILISVGGWSGSGPFSDLALTRASRARFITSALQFLRHHDLDGLDIDWEYPGQPGAGNPHRPADRANFTLLLAELRQRLNQQGNVHGHPLRLTIAAEASRDFLAHTEMRQVARSLDTVNLMTYDFREPADNSLAGPHAPLFASPLDPESAASATAVADFIAAGVPAEKLLLGVPFYAHIWRDVPPAHDGLYQRANAAKPSYAAYSAIASGSLGPASQIHFDPATCNAWLYNPDRKLFASFDDPRSIACKSTYILSHHLGGIMFWHYDADNGDLLKTINSTLRPSVGGQH